MEENSETPTPVSEFGNSTPAESSAGKAAAVPQSPETSPSQRRSGMRIRRISTPERQLTRREFLKILGVGGVLAGAAALGMRVSRKPEAGKERKGDQQTFVAVEGETIAEHRKIFGFHPEATRRFVREQNLPPEDYGKLAAAGVSFMEIFKEDGEYYIGEASGGLAEYRREYYLVTTMHVLANKLHLSTRKKTSLFVNIPGIQHMYLCEPREIYTFNPSPNPEQDSPVFIKLDEELTSKVGELKTEGELTPLQPMPIYEGFDQPITLFRFQGGNVGLHDYQIKYADEEANVDRYRVAADTPSGCPGISGAVGLERKGSKLTGKFLGTFTHGAQHIYGVETTQFAPDIHGVLGSGNSCSMAANFTSFGKDFFSWGMKRTKLPN